MDLHTSRRVCLQYTDDVDLHQFALESFGAKINLKTRCIRHTQLTRFAVRIIGLISLFQIGLKMIDKFHSLH